MDCGESWTCLLRSTGFEGVHCSVTSRWDNGGLVAKRHPTSWCGAIGWREKLTSWSTRNGWLGWPQPKHCRHLAGASVGIWGESPRVTRSDAGAGQGNRASEMPVRLLAKALGGWSWNNQTWGYQYWKYAWLCVCVFTFYVGHEDVMDITLLAPRRT